MSRSSSSLCTPLLAVEGGKVEEEEEGGAWPEMASPVERSTGSAGSAGERGSMGDVFPDDVAEEGCVEVGSMSAAGAAAGACISL